MNKKRVIIIHGFQGKPNSGWKPWIKKKLLERGFEVSIPAMPTPYHPKMKAWIDKIYQVVGTPDENTFFIGHSLGCIAIARYLSTLLDDIKVGGCVFVAGFSGNLKIPELREFYALPFDPEKAKIHTKNFVMIHSRDDEDVPIEKALEFHKQLGGKFITENGMGHYSGGEGITEVPTVLKELLNLMS